VVPDLATRLAIASKTRFCGFPDDALKRPAQCDDLAARAHQHDARLFGHRDGCTIGELRADLHVRRGGFDDHESLGPCRHCSKTENNRRDAKQNPRSHPSSPVVGSLSKAADPVKKVRRLSRHFVAANNSQG
jgi:hypothetical protein